MKKAMFVPVLALLAIFTLTACGEVVNVPAAETETVILSHTAVGLPKAEVGATEVVIPPTVEALAAETAEAGDLPPATDAPVTEAAQAEPATDVSAAQAVQTEAVQLHEDLKSGQLAQDYEGTTPVQMQLLLGTLKLEGTAQAVDSPQAQVLLPLWQAVRDLSESGTSTPEEIEATVKQIQAAMTPEQIAAIAAMQVTFQDVRAIGQELGLEFGFGGGQFGDMDPDARATRQAARGSDQPPADGFGGRSGTPGPGRFAGGNPGLPLPWLDALIDILEVRAQ